MRPCAIVPSYNHWEAIGTVTARLRGMGLVVFVIDDGSAEPAASAIAALSEAGGGVVVHRLPENQGKGAAVVAGFRLALDAGFTHAVQVDADGQHDLDALPALLTLARAHPLALVTGQPVHDASISFGRKAGRWVTHICVWIETLSLRITDSMCGFRVYPLAAVSNLLASEALGSHMAFDPEIMVRLFWRGTEVIGLPVRVTYPPENTSNFSTFGMTIFASAECMRGCSAACWRACPGGCSCAYPRRIGHRAIGRASVSVAPFWGCGSAPYPIEFLVAAAALRCWHPLTKATTIQIAVRFDNGETQLVSPSALTDKLRDLV